MNFTDFKAKFEKVAVDIVPNRVDSKPIVSVCVSTYQHIKFIRDCLEGILAQRTDYPFEILLGEDNSSDGTRQVCIEYAQQYPDKIRLFLHHRENLISILGRPTGRFNMFYSLFAARGKYIAFCEGDDYWTDPNKLQRQIEFLENNNEYSLTYHAWTSIREDQKIDSENLTRMKLISSSRTLTLVFRNVLADMPNEIIDAPNGDAFLRFILKQHGQFKCIKGISPAVRRVHSGGVMGPLSELEKLPRRILTHQKLLETYRGTEHERGLERKVDQYKIHHSVMSALYGGDSRVSHLSQAFRLACKNRLLWYSIKYLFRKIMKSEDDPMLSE